MRSLKLYVGANGRTLLLWSPLREREAVSRLRSYIISGDV